MGLSPTMTRFLSERLRANSDKEAAERLNIPVKTVYQWKTDFPEFRELYNGLSSDGVRIAMEMLRQHLGKAAEVVIDAMEAKDARGKPDHIVRMNAARLNLQAHGLLKERQVVQGDPDNPVEMRVSIVRNQGNRKIDNSTGETPGPGADSPGGSQV